MGITSFFFIFLNNFVHLFLFFFFNVGQYIGKIDGGSPAEAAGLREGDRIVEVNIAANILIAK